MEQDIQKYLDNARRAKEKGDWERVERYYSLVEENASEHIEAIFYASYARLRESLTMNDLYKRRTAFELLGKSIVIIWQIFERENPLLEVVLVKKMGEDILNLLSCKPVPVYRQAVRQKGAYIQVGQEEIGFSEFFSMQRQIVKKFASFIEWFVQKHPASSEILGASLQAFKERVDAAKRVEEIEAKYSGCYVATCVYGSYDCPEVWTLRRYRDEKLGATWYGRAFIRTYYAISPTLVRWFGHTAWFKKFWKGKLDRMVARLRAKGVEDTPYQDKKW